MKTQYAILITALLFALTSCIDTSVNAGDENGNGNGNGDPNGELTLVVNFNDYRGTEATLPDGMFVTWDEDRTDNPFTGVGNLNTSDPTESYGGFTAFTAGNDDYSFGIREREPVDLRDSRLFLEFTNNTDQLIFEFAISYDVEAWFIGDRRNRIRLKYDNDLEASGSFDEDIFSTDNPSSETTPGSKVNGSLAANRVTVSGTIDVSELEREGQTLGPVSPGATVYFRWQFSNADGDGGDLRSGLAINNISITPIID